MHWLLEPTALRRLIHAQENFHDTAALIAWETAQASAEAAPAPEQREPAQRESLPAGMSVAGSTAEIRVEGVLTKRPDFWAKYFLGGNTTYASIRSALAVAASSPEITDVVLKIDSPGGNAEGLIETLETIAHFRQYSGKRIRARADNAQSAAYGIAAAAGNIEATGRGATFGSIGTAVSYYVSPNVVTLTNTDSPDKRPDLTTPEGKAVVVKYLDQLNHEFVSSIAQGRGVELSRVTERYGRGASMTASEAKRLGLIDTIATTAPRAVPHSSSKGNPTTMADNQEPDRAALDAASQRGVTQERDRVLAHLTMGESCGDMSIALEAIRSGASMTQEFTARYLSAGMNRGDRNKRQAESNTAEAQLAGVGAATPTEKTDLGDQVVAELKAQRAGKEFVRA
jgi:ClpP class serine protease